MTPGKREVAVAVSVFKRPFPPGDRDQVSHARTAAHPTAPGEGRLFPGEGGLPLKAFLAALPGDIPIGLEVPTGRTHPHLDAKQRAAAACMAGRELLASRRPIC